MQWGGFQGNSADHEQWNEKRKDDEGSARSYRPPEGMRTRVSPIHPRKTTTTPPRPSSKFRGRRGRGGVLGIALS